MNEIEKAIETLKDFNKCVTTKADGSYSTVDFVEARVLAISALQQQLTNGWIATSERLPEGKEFEITDEDGETMYRHVLCQLTRGTNTFDIGFYQDGDWFDAYAFGSMDVIAWQPLPSTWKGENND